jgi:4,5-dihydroxyphthalate decarboxylase
MRDLELSLSINQYDRVAPLLTGEVKAHGITLNFYPLAGPDIFYRQLKFSQFDVSEMSFSSFLMGRERGWKYRALPVFNHREYEYTKLLVRKDSGVERPEDLKGKRIGTGDYQQTAAVWFRGQLQHEFGVKPTDMEWFMARSQRYSHAGALGGLKLPTGLKLSYATKDLGTMLLNGELDVAHYQFGASIDRAKTDVSGHPNLRYLFPDRKTEAARYYKKHGFFPAHHLTVVRESILEQYPWVAISLFEAFERAKALAMERTRSPRLSLVLFGTEILREQDQTFSPDPYVYGIKANAKMIDTLLTYSVEQGLTERKQPLEELFPEELLIAEEKL